MYTSPLAISVRSPSGARSMISSYSGSCSDSKSCVMRCPRAQRNTGIGVSTLPDGA